MMRTKAIAVFLSVVISLVCLSIWQVDRAYFGDQTTQSEATARSQISALIPAAQVEFRSLFDHQKFLSALTLDKGINEFGDGLSHRVEMIAHLKAGLNGDWVVDSKAFNSKTSVRSWAENYTTIALKAVKPHDILGEGAALVALNDPQRKTYFLWIFHDDKDQWSAAITKPNIFQNLMDRQKGQFSTVFIVNQQAQVLGHTTAEYLGTSMADDPMVHELTRAGKRAGSTVFREAGSPVQSFYEQIPNTNAYVVIHRPLSVVQKSREAVRWQLILLGGGFLFVGLAALLYLMRGDGEGFKFALRRSRSVASTDPAPPTEAATSPAPAPAPVAPTAPSDLEKERMTAYAKAAAAVARELNGPMAKILALTKALTSRQLTSEQQLEVAEISEMARDSRAVLLKLLSFAGEEEFRREGTALYEVVSRLLNAMETQLQTKGIKLERNLKRVMEIDANFMGLTKAIEAILINSIEAMERMPNKKLLVDLDGNEKWVTVRVRDSGEGVSAENLKLIFDPFYTSKQRSLHSGLGLPMALGVVREFGGDIIAESEVGQGTTIEIRMPVTVVAPAKPPPKPAPALPHLDRRENSGLTRMGPPPPPPAKPLGTPARPPVSTPPKNLVNSPLVPPILQERALRETMDAIENLDGFTPAAPPTKPPTPPALMAYTVDQDDENESTAMLKDDFVEKKLNDPPARPAPPPVRGTEGTSSQKIDRPNIGVRVGGPKLVGDVAIRKPGEPPQGGRK